FLPGTWSHWATKAPGRPAIATADPQNAWDAIYSAARMLCGDHIGVSDIRSALFSYNHSSEYVDAVLAQAGLYAADRASEGAQDAGPTYPGDGRSVVAFA